MQLHGMKAAVIGMGRRTAPAVISFLLKHGAKVDGYDDREWSEIQNEFPMKDDPAFTFLHGIPEAKQSNFYSLAVISPGVSIHHPFVLELKKSGTEVISEVELAFRFAKAPILAITGTNGKTTTTELLGRIAEMSGLRVYVGGNIGHPLLNAVDKDYEWLIAEISSFQLEAVERFRPKVAALLNISPNHLDRHLTMEEYVSTKMRLFQRMQIDDVAVLNGDDEGVRKITSQLQCQKRFFSKSKRNDSSIWTEGETAIFSDGTRVTFQGRKIFGDHNKENILAAFLMARELGCTPSAMQSAVAEFSGVQYRTQYLGEIKGVDFFNDAKSTTSDSTLRAMESMTKPTHLILGGRAKVKDESGFVSICEKHPLVQIYVFGEIRESLAKILSHPRIVKRESLAEIMEVIMTDAKSGEAVLFSPGHASFDQYQDYEARGAHFDKLFLAYKEAKT